MLAEVLLVLAGHPSSFFVPFPPAPSTPTALVVSSKLEAYLHPGETSTLNSLADLAFKYTKIRDWATQIQRQGRDAVLRQSTKGKQKDSSSSPPNQYLCTLASGLLEVLREWDTLIVELETGILALDPGLVQDEMGHVPLSTLIAALSPWQAPLASLVHLVDQLRRNRMMTSGKLIDLVGSLTENGNPKIRDIFTALSRGLERLFLTHLTVFILNGITSTTSDASAQSIGLDGGVDPLSPGHRTYELNSQMLPASVSPSARASILYNGRVAATLRREERQLPRNLMKDIRDEIMALEGLDRDDLDRAINRARAEVGE